MGSGIECLAEFYRRTDRCVCVPRLDLVFIGRSFRLQVVEQSSEWANSRETRYTFGGFDCALIGRMNSLLATRVSSFTIHSLNGELSSEERR